MDWGWTKKLKIPYYPTNNNGNKENPYILSTIEEKIISNYLGISLIEVLELNILQFKFFLREAFIYNCSQTESGIDYLISAKRLETTEPERNKLREKMG